jgi:hypothetical protein
MAGKIPFIYFFYRLHKTDLQSYAKWDKGEMVLAKQYLPDTKFSPVKSYIFKVQQNSHRTMLKYSHMQNSSIKVFPVEKFIVLDFYTKMSHFRQLWHSKVKNQM